MNNKLYLSLLTKKVMAMRLRERRTTSTYIERKDFRERFEEYNKRCEERRKKYNHRISGGVIEPEEIWMGDRRYHVPKDGKRCNFTIG